jgi:hypothetical protein
MLRSSSMTPDRERPSRSTPAAVLSADGRYRYFLSRRWDERGKVIAFIGLNPSTADESKDDPTIRRCTRFAKDLGGGALWVVNLFALRATKPFALVHAPDPIGPENEHWLDEVVAEADLSIAAWGNQGTLMGRAAVVSARFAGNLHALSITRRGMPGHPLYISAENRPQLYFG